MKLKLFSKFYIGAIFKIALFSCFFMISPILIAQDSDGDMVVDSIDLDDDNDGILDKVEICNDTSCTVSTQDISASFNGLLNARQFVLTGCMMQTLSSGTATPSTDCSNFDVAFENRFYPSPTNIAYALSYQTSSGANPICATGRRNLGSISASTSGNIPDCTSSTNAGGPRGQATANVLQDIFLGTDAFGFPDIPTGSEAGLSASGLSQSSNSGTTASFGIVDSPAPSVPFAGQVNGTAMDYVIIEGYVAFPQTPGGQVTMRLNNSNPSNPANLRENYIALMVSDDENEENLKFAGEAITSFGGVQNIDIVVDTEVGTIPSNVTYCNHTIRFVRLYYLDPSLGGAASMSWDTGSGFTTIPVSNISSINPLASISTVCDADNDSIPNRLDLDSDNDGCADIEEAGGSFTVADDGVTAPSTLSDGNGGVVTTNLGTTVGATLIGVPNVVGTGQSVGNTLDGLDYCTDTDLDGVPDIVDLDDDNDGILDTVECFVSCLPSTTGLTSSAIPNRTWTVRAFRSEHPANRQQSCDDTTTTLGSSMTFEYGNGTYVSPNGLNIGAPRINTLSNTANYTTWNVTGGRIPATPFLVVFEYTMQAGDEGFYTFNTNAADGQIIFGNDCNGRQRRLICDDWFGTELSLNRPIYYAEGDVLRYIVTEWGVGSNWIEMQVEKFETPTNLQNAVACDLDGDGIINSLDLDSDGDGCPDAVESGVLGIAGLTTGDLVNTGGTVSGVDNTKFVFVSPTNDSNRDGFFDGADGATQDGNPEYQSTYDQYALNSGLNSCGDTDGDGIPDIADLDDDNDGILDGDESPGCFVTEADANVPARITSDFNSPDDDQSDGDIQILHDGDARATFNFDTVQSTGVGTTLFTLEFPTQVNLSAVEISDNIATNSSFSTQQAKLYGSFDGSSWQELSISDVSLTRTPITFPVEQNSAEYQYYSVRTTSFVILLTTNTIGEITATLTSGYNASSHPLATCSDDTDGDGIVNHLDLDSDGDGCPDATEGAGTFIKTLVDASSTDLQGGNTGAGFSGNTGVSPVLENLSNNVGNTPTTLGVPTVATTGQATGFSTDKNANACLDSDGDGVGDITDLDDDNDGILDTDECQEGLSFNLEYTNLRANTTDDTIYTSSTPTAPSWTADLSENGSVIGVQHFTATRGATSRITTLINPPTILSTNASNLATSAFGVGSNNVIIGSFNVGTTAFVQYSTTIENTTAVPQKYTLSYASNASSFGGGVITGGWGINHNSSPGTATVNYDNTKVIATITDYNNPDHEDPVTSLHTAGFVGTETVPLPDGTTFTIDDGTSGLRNTNTIPEGLGFSVNYEVTLDPGDSTTLITMDNGATQVDNYGFIVSSFVSCGSDGLDTDGDGIPNTLDLDSDGDGCPDAVEGDASFEQTDLSNAIGTGLDLPNNNNNDGSIATGYLGNTTASVLGNLTNANGVDTDPNSATYGVPLTTLANTPNTQGIGGSQDVNDDSSCCNVVTPTITP